MLILILLFAVALLLPLGLVLWGVHDDLLRELVVAGGALVAAAVVAAWLLRRRPRRDDRALARPDPATVAKLKWPARLSPAQFEAYCAEFLRQQGWVVTPAQSNEASGVYLDASRPGARALLLCESQGEKLNALAARTLALVATSFAGARPVLLTTGRVTAATSQAAADAGVSLLTVADLPQLPSLATQPATPPPP